MGIRGEIFSNKVLLRNRSYFFNVKETRTGDLYLNIVESKNREDSGFDRQSVILFAEDLQEFLQGFDEALRMLERSIHEKRRSAYGNGHGRGGATGGAKARQPEAGRQFGRDKPFRSDKPLGSGKPFGQDKPFGSGKPFRSGKPFGSDKPFGHDKSSGKPGTGRPVKVFRKKFSDR
ncbi:MAG: DUF3276 family protein [Spirochaetaceae bacterium]|jgi:hypothetical protein|nr:DUF3276 family protein [Spirochaetaceae bacterium]